MSSTSWPAAVSERSTHRVVGPDRVEARVLAAWPAAAYLLVEDAVLPVVTPGALRLPTSLVVAADAPVLGWGVQPGDRVTVGGGEVVLPGVTLRVVRSWRPRRVPTSRHRADGGLPADGPWSGPATALVTGLLARDDIATRVAALVGAGGGLTPSGDDVLCGVLLGLRVRGDDAARATLWSVVRPRLGRTTSLSSSLLVEAATGYAVPAVVRLAEAVAAGDALEAVRAAAQVRRIGHTSGSDLLAGLAAALAAPGTTLSAVTEGAHR